MVTVAALLILAPAAAGQWTLNDGTKVSFVFVQPSQKQAWRPNGESIPYASLPKPTAAVWSAKDTDPVLIALINPSQRTGNGPSVRFKLPSTDELRSSFNVICSDRKIWMAGLKPSTGQPSEQDLAIGVADGPWKVVSWVEFRQSGHGVHALKVHGAPIRLSVNGNGPTMGGPYTFVNVPSTNDHGNVDFRFVVKARDGGKMESEGLTPTQQKGATTYRFNGNVENVSQVILETRRFEWHTLRVAHFRPNSN